jgi:tetratricopeptide (TPR) repeat protein
LALFEIASFSALANVLLAARKFATDPDPLNRMKALADLAKDGKALTAAIKGAGLSPLAAEMAKRAKALDRHLTHEGWAKDDAKAIFLQVAPLALADPNHLAAAALDPEAATEAMVAAILASDHTRDFRQTAYAETYFREIISGALAVMLADRTFVDSITPALWRQVLAGQGIQIDRLDAIKGNTEELLNRIDFLTRKVSQLEGAQEARAAGVSDSALFRLVRPIAEHITDRDEALLALQEAVQIARRVQEEGRHGTNLGDFVDAVLGRVRALSAQGEHRAAISELDAALAREEAESKARTLRLLSAAIDQHLLAFDAIAAAEKLARRVDLETPDPATRFEALTTEHNLWYERGRDRGLRLDLEVAIAIARIALRRATDCDQRGAALNNLGNVLAILGERETGTERLQEAIAAYRAALEEITIDRAPLDWATIQNNLGNAHQILGQRETGTQQLEAAVEAFRAALRERSRDRVPLDWAMTQNNLGNAFRTLGEREAGTDRLEEAVTAYRAALEERTRDRSPLYWATTQSNLGNTLATLGEREAGTARLEEAVAAYRAALEERTRDRVPLDWATTQNNFGNALQTLGQREAGTARLEEAVAAYRAALEERTRDRVPLDWAATQNNLGTALQTLGQREAGIARLEEAVAAYRAALEERTRDRVPLDWASTRGNMSGLHLALFDKTGDPAELDRAQAALDDARAVFAEAGASQYLAQAARQQAAIDARRRR